MPHPVHQPSVLTIYCLMFAAASNQRAARPAFGSGAPRRCKPHKLEASIKPHLLIGRVLQRSAFARLALRPQLQSVSTAVAPSSPPQVTEAMTTEKPITSVVVLIAMEAEAQPLIEKLDLKLDVHSKFVPPAPCVSHSGSLGNLDISVVTMGKCKTTSVDNVGTVPAALTSYIALETLKPDLLINAGTAGGFKSQGASIGDVYVSSACVNHDRRIPLPQYDAYGLGMKPSLSTENLRAKLGLSSGVVSTGNSLDYTHRCMEIMKANSASAKDMEAAAVAWVADLFGTPLFCLKAITDLVDGEHPPQEEFLKNLQTASLALRQTVAAVLEFIDGKTLSEL